MIEENEAKAVKKKGKYTKSEWKDFLIEAQNRHEERYSEPITRWTESESFVGKGSGKTDDSYREDVKQDVKEFDKKNKNDLTNCLNYYKETLDSKYALNNYKVLDCKYIKEALSDCKIMILTANPIEKAVFHKIMLKEYNDKIIKITYENLVYYILKWNKYWVAHIHQSETGAHKNWGSNRAIYEALKCFTPNVIISLGIAFGIDYKTQSIGDV